MDRRFNTEHFEKSLKAQADDFKMEPSKKVWHGIYNDLHPGTRWPSVAMSLVFIFVLVIIGHLNTNNGKILASLTSAQKAAFAKTTVTKKKAKAHNTRLSNNNSLTNNITDPSNDNNIIADNSTPSISTPGQTITSPFSQDNAGSSDDLSEPFTALNETNNANNTKAITGSDLIASSNQSSNTKSNTNKDIEVVTKNDEPILKKDNVVNKSISGTKKENTNETGSNSKLINTVKTGKSTGIKKENEVTFLIKTPDAKPQVKNKAKETSTSEEEKKSGTSFLSKKVRDKMSVSYYVTPSVGYRNLSQKSMSFGSSQNSSSTSPNFSNASINNYVVNRATIGFEAGASLNYKISKRWQGTMGLQLNYTGYNIKANYVHPVQTSLLLISDFTGEPYAYNSMSNYGNGTSSALVTLHQYSFQGSVPFGLKYMIAGNDNIQFNAEATIQPSYIIANKSYLLSGDRRNFVNDPLLVRNFNMTTNFGTFISFKSSNFNWQIGPQMFYQVFSTYAHNYPTQEHLVNYGIRFGISKLKK